MRPEHEPWLAPVIGVATGLVTAATGVFVILEKELDHDDGELTATQKVRRGLVNRKFARELALIYGEA